MTLRNGSKVRIQLKLNFVLAPGQKGFLSSQDVSGSFESNDQDCLNSKCEWVIETADSKDQIIAGQTHVLLKDSNGKYLDGLYRDLSTIFLTPPLTPDRATWIINLASEEQQRQLNYLPSGQQRQINYNINLPAEEQQRQIKYNDVVYLTKAFNKDKKDNRDMELQFLYNNGFVVGFTGDNSRGKRAYFTLRYSDPQPAEQPDNKEQQDEKEPPAEKISRMMIRNGSKVRIQLSKGDEFEPLYLDVGLISKEDTSDELGNFYLQSWYEECFKSNKCDWVIETADSNYDQIISGQTPVSLRDYRGKYLYHGNIVGPPNSASVMSDRDTWILNLPSKEERQIKYNEVVYLTNASKQAEVLLSTDYGFLVGIKAEIEAAQTSSVNARVAYLSLNDPDSKQVMRWTCASGECKESPVLFTCDNGDCRFSRPGEQGDSRDKCIKKCKQQPKPQPPDDQQDEKEPPAEQPDNKEQQDEKEPPAEQPDNKEQQDEKEPTGDSPSSSLMSSGLLILVLVLSGLTIGGLFYFIQMRRKGRK